MVLNVIILHCHFQRGGVTQVVQNHSASLIDHPNIDQVALLGSDRADGLSPETLRRCHHFCVGQMDYDDAETAPVAERAEVLQQTIERYLNSFGFTKSDTVLHWHNHSLGKNVAAPRVIQALAESGWRLLLQIHDFAEDFRPANHARLIAACEEFAHQPRPVDVGKYCYPTGPTIRYATLTSGDAEVLRAMGMPSDRVHCLPNSVNLGDDAMPDKESSLERVRQANRLPQDARWMLYPVRGIRRKNVGEFLLLSRWTAEKTFAGLTLSPTTPIEQTSYQRWKSVAKELAPRAVFDCGMHDSVSFSQNLAASDLILSTSVAEGFGMAFLEPWLAGRRVLARDLPGVTNDFRGEGVKLDSFYQSIPVPLGKDEMREAKQEINSAFKQAVSKLPKAFRPRLDGEADPGDSSDDSKTIDFAYLIPARQIQILQRLHDDPGFENEMRSLSPKLCDDLDNSASSDVDSSGLISENADAIRRRYSLQQCGHDLVSIYDQILHDDPARGPAEIDGLDRSIEAICARRPFYPCRTETFDEP